MDDMFNYMLQNGFAITVAIYLLYERSKFNIKIAKHLAQIALMMERIDRRIEK